MERSVFLEMSPVLSERTPSVEELAEFRRRAERPPRRLAPYVAVPVLLLLTAQILKENAITAGWPALLSFLPGVLLLLFGLVRLRDLVVESQALKSASERSKILTFQNLGKWMPASEFVLPTHPETIDVLFPERLVIAAGGKMRKIFTPIVLTQFVDSPLPGRDAEFRNLHAWERAEIAKSQKRYRWKVVGSLIGMGVCAYMTLSGVFAVLSGRVPNFYDAIAGPIGLWLLLSELREAFSMSKKLDKALEDSRVSVWWDNDKFTEYLAVSQLLWRNESGPARWRHAERDQTAGPR